MTFQDNNTSNGACLELGTFTHSRAGWTFDGSPENVERARRALSGRITRPPRQRKPSHNTIVARARKLGASSVTVDGVTYRFGEAIETDDIDRELAAFGARHGNA